MAKKQVKHSDRAHAILSASSSDRWMNCAGSIQACADLPPQPSNIYAEEGTAAHELAEKCLVEGKDTEAYLGRFFNKCKLKPKGFEVTKGMVDHVQVYVDAVREEMEPGKTLLVEKKFDLGWLHPGMFGTNDAAVEEPFGTLFIADLKYGIGVVEVEDNSQLMYYALGAAENNDYENIKMMIGQPRASHIDGSIRTHTITAEELEQFKHKLKAAAVATEQENPEFKAGDHCKYCRALPTCETARKTALEVAIADFDPVEDTAKTLTLPEPDSLNSTQLGRVLDMANFINGWVKSVEAYAFGQAQKGQEIEGRKLVQKRANRKWIDEKNVAQELKSLGEDRYSPRKLKTPAQMEKVVDKKIVATLCEKPDAGTTLVAVSDNRSAVRPAIESDFDPVE